MRCLTVSLCLLVSAGALGQATADDQQWFAQMNALMKDQSPKAARQRATLAYWALTAYAGRAQRLGIDPNVVRSQGIKDILAAAAGLPDSPGIWREVEAWDRLGGFDALGGARIACPISEREPANAEVAEVCGDMRKESGDVPGATRAWRHAAEVATNRDDKIRVIIKIDRSSPAPERDLSGISPTLVQQARMKEQQQAAAAQVQASQQAAASSAAVQNCQSACNLQASNCHAAVGYGAWDSCEPERSNCLNNCAATGGASAPAVSPYVPPVYAPYPVFPY